MGMMSARWWSGLLLAGLVLPGCCSTCGKKTAWSGSPGVASNNRLQPSYPGAPSGMAANTMTPPATAGMQPAQQVQPAGFNQPRGMISPQQPTSNLQSMTPSHTPPGNGPETNPANYYNKPIGGSRAHIPPPGNSSPLTDSYPVPPASNTGAMPPSNVVPAGGSMEPPAPTTPSMPPSMPPSGSTGSPSEPPIIPGPPSPPGE